MEGDAKTLSFRWEWNRYWSKKYRKRMPEILVFVPGRQINKLVGKYRRRIPYLKEKYPESNIYVAKEYVFFNDFDRRDDLLEELRKYYFHTPDEGMVFGEEEAKRALLLLREMDFFAQNAEKRDAHPDTVTFLKGLVARRRMFFRKTGIPLCHDANYFAMRRKIGSRTLPRSVNVPDESRPIEISRIELGCELFVQIVELMRSHFEQDYVAKTGQFVLNLSDAEEKEDRDGRKMLDVICNDYSDVGLGADLQFITSDEWADEIKNNVGIDLKQSRLRNWLYNSYLTLFSLEPLEVQEVIVHVLKEYVKNGTLPDEFQREMLSAINWPPQPTEEKLCVEYFKTFKRTENKRFQRLVKTQFFRNRFVALDAFETIFGKRFEFEHRKHSRVDGIQVLLSSYHRLVMELEEALRLRNRRATERVEFLISDVGTRTRLVHRMLRNVKGLWSIPFRIAHECGGKLGNAPFPEGHPDWGVLNPLELIRSIALGEEPLEDDHADVDGITAQLERL